MRPRPRAAARGSRGADPGDDLVVDRAGRVGPVLRRRLAVSGPAEEHDLVTGPRRRTPGRGRRRTGPCTPGPRPCRRCPPTRTGPGAAGGPRDAVGVAHRHQAEHGVAVGDVLVAVADALPGAGALDQGEPRGHPHRLAQPEVGRGRRGRAPATARRRPGRGAPGRSGAEGLVSVAAELARCRTSGARRPARRSAAASTKRTCWARTVGCCGASAHAKCDQTPVTSMAPSACARGDRARPARASR